MLGALVFLAATLPTVARPAPSPLVPSAPDAAANLVFFEALGNGLLYSVNYERLVDDQSVGFRAGFSYFTHAVSDYGQSGNLTLVSIPIVASYYVPLGSGSAHKIQLGFGATVLYLHASTDSEGIKFGNNGFSLAATGIVGYRYLPRDGGITLGIGFTPLLRPGDALPWGGANIGWLF
jgi:hypothetical protein